MTPQIDADTFRLRIEQKINVIAKAINWILGASLGGGAYLVARRLELDANTAFYAALGVAGLACWFIMERPMRQIEKRLPLFGDDD